MTKQTIAKQLQASIPPECISERQGLSYISGRYVKQRLNEVFGWDGWSYEIRSVQLDPANTGAFCHLRLFVGSGDEAITRDGMAYGYASGRTGAEAYDFAIAESVTDALKRAAVSLGQNLGLELYPMTKGADVPQPGEAISNEDILKTKAFATDIAEAKTLEKLRAVWNDVLNAHLHPSAVSGLATHKDAKKRELEGP